MLQSLRVKNLAVVENAYVEFGPALNVITGETGAGKSIIVNALGLVLGDRADKSLIRTGEAQCSVDAVFQLEDCRDVNAALDALGLEPIEGGQLIVRRIVSATGAGRQFLNDNPTTTQALKQLGDLLVDMHGPHDHQSLLSQEFQLAILDAYARLDAERDRYALLHREMLDLAASRAELEGAGANVAEQLELLRYQIDELESAQIRADEAATLDDEHTVAANAQRILELAGEACAGLTDGEQSAFDTLTRVQKSLEELARIMPDGAGWLEEARAANVQIQELARSIQHAVDRLDSDPKRLQWLEERKSLYEKLKRKYGPTVPDVLRFLETARRKLQDLESREERLADLDRRQGELQAKLETAGRALGTKRRKASGKLAASITAALRDLGFAQGAFDVALREVPPRATGMDEAEFGFAPNVGETMRPLRAIASSGEISRVMLAVKSVLASHDRIPLLVFDEIDANLGGEMGNAVGAKLKTVAGGHQVICITHLPQVAVYGTSHFVVAKTVEKSRTFTHIQLLGNDVRPREIARMLGGEKLTSVTLQHAREMLKNI